MSKMQSFTGPSVASDATQDTIRMIHLADVVIRAQETRKRPMVQDDRGRTTEVKFATRKGQKAPKGAIIPDASYRLACVEGDAEWTDLLTGLPVAGGAARRSIGQAAPAGRA